MSASTGTFAQMRHSRQEMPDQIRLGRALVTPQLWQCCAFAAIDSRAAEQRMRKEPLRFTSMPARSHREGKSMPHCSAPSTGLGAGCK